MYRLGISISHNSACALFYQDKFIVAVQEERLNGIKKARFNSSHKLSSVEYCLSAANIGIEEVSAVDISVQGYAEGQVEALLSSPSFDKAKEDLEITTTGHHLAHAYSAHFSSGYKDSVCLVIDGMGSPACDLDQTEKLNSHNDDWEALSIYHLSDTGYKVLHKEFISEGKWLETSKYKIESIGSLGGLYAACSLVIFGDRDSAGKVMGLAALGKPTYSVDEFISFSENGMTFNCSTLNENFRTDEILSYESYANLAASVQHSIEVAVLHYLNKCRTLSNTKNFTFSGGVALNCIVNEKIVEEALFDNHFFMPACEDNGTAIGAVAAKQNISIGSEYTDQMGMFYNNNDIETDIAVSKYFTFTESSEDLLLKELMKYRSISIFYGSSEFGPRALGNRSIIADPRFQDTQDNINSLVKYREGFRPFAPIVLEEQVLNYFDLSKHDTQSRFMLRVCKAKTHTQKNAPAICHADNSSRVQTISLNDNRPVAHLLRSFNKETGLPILLNTSFNIDGEPIVEEPYDALVSMLASGIKSGLLGDKLVKSAVGGLFQCEFRVRPYELVKVDNEESTVLVKYRNYEVVSNFSNTILNALNENNGSVLDEFYNKYFRNLDIDRDTFIKLIVKLSRQRIIEII